MKRIHIHLSVNDIAASVRFYTDLFGAAPTVSKPDYAKWMLDDPRVNFAMSSHPGEARGIEHIGIQSETESELTGVFERVMAAKGPVFDEAASQCCYAQSTKKWTTDPDGVPWETFFTKDTLDSYGERFDAAKIKAECEG